MAKTNIQLQGREKSCWLRGRQVVRSLDGSWSFPLVTPTTNQIARTDWQLSDVGQREVTSLAPDSVCFVFLGSFFFFFLYFSGKVGGMPVVLTARHIRTK